MAVHDTFNRADNATSLGTADSGQLWIPRLWAPHDAIDAPIGQSTSVLGISSGAVIPGDGSHVHMATIDHGTAEVDAVLELLLPFPVGGGAGMVARWAGDTQFFEAFVYHDVSGPQTYTGYLRRVDGPSTVVVVGTAPSLVANTASGTYQFAVSAVGDQWTFRFEGIVVGSFVDNTYSGATHHGVLSYFSTAAIIDSYNGRAPGGWSVGRVRMV